MRMDDATEQIFVEKGAVADAYDEGFIRWSCKTNIHICGEGEGIRANFRDA